MIHSATMFTSVTARNVRGRYTDDGRSGTAAGFTPAHVTRL